MNRLTKSSLLTGVVVAALVLSSPLAANASDATAAAGPDRAALERLSATQSRAEIDALVEGTSPVRLLVDAATGRVEAAAPITTRALTPVGPGCTQTSVCMRTISGVPYGLTGTGTKTGSWKKIIRISAGDRRTSFWASNGMGYEYRAGSDVVMNVTVTITKVQR